MRRTGQTESQNKTTQQSGQNQTVRCGPNEKSSWNPEKNTGPSDNVSPLKKQPGQQAALGMTDGLEVVLVLVPELPESSVHLSESTEHPSWLEVGPNFLVWFKIGSV